MSVARRRRALEADDPALSTETVVPPRCKLRMRDPIATHHAEVCRTMLQDVIGRTPLHNFLRFDRTIGRGRFGRVRLVHMRTDLAGMGKLVRAATANLALGIGRGGGGAGADDGGGGGKFPLCFALKMVSCLLYTSPSPRDLSTSRMPSSA